ncbi:MAG: lipopolysaccharide assembly protein LapA domain-containing protein [Thermotogota bacterium]
MKKFKLTIIIIVSVLLFLLIVQNTNKVQTSFLWFKGEISLIVLLLITTIGGYIVGLLTSILNKRNKNKKE